MASAVQNFITRNRGMVIFLVVVPISFLYQQWQDFNNWIYRTFFATNKLHDRRVAEIQQMVKEAHASGKKMCTARAPWKTMSIRKATYKDDLAKIPINLRNVLSIDREKMILRVEPMATMGDITHYLVKKGLALSVQVEMDDLTVGGLLMGIGIETTSHRYGFLFETVEAFEIVTAEGELVRATRDSHPELFHSLPMSHGTLGFLVAAELRIVPVKRFMKVEYRPFHSMKQFSYEMKRLAETEGEADFLEGLVFSAQEGVIMVGQMTDRAESGKVNPINLWFKPWFYTHVAKFLQSGEAVEYIPLRHYFHRHTPSIFFQFKDLVPFANEAWYRWLFAWMGAPKISLMKYSMTKELRKRAIEGRVAQDILVPMKDLEESVALSEKYYGIYPLWICPVRMYNHGNMEGILKNPENTNEGDWAMFVDVGIYGIPESAPRGEYNAIETSRALEHYTQGKGGFHMLYADIFMTRKEFEEMFNHNLYKQVRKNYKADTAFPAIYDKVIPEKWLINVEEGLESEGEKAKQKKVLEEETVS